MADGSEPIQQDVVDELLRQAQAAPTSAAGFAGDASEPLRLPRPPPIRFSARMKSKLY